MNACLVAVVFVALAITLAEATVCVDDSPCGSDECCYIEPEFLVASKRQLLLPPMPANHHKIGVCEKYLTEGIHCDFIDTMNGHCGCAAGLHCAFVPAPSTVGPGGRRAVRGAPFMPGPGAYRCTPKL